MWVTGGLLMKKNESYLIIQGGSIQTDIPTCFQFEEIYGLLSTNEVSVILFPNNIDIWVKATEKCHNESYTEIMIDRVPVICFVGNALIASSDEGGNIQGLSNKQMEYIQKI